ncbi:hypothetical protein PFISCL1PPCAC_8187, partial [Pristionchus fissidentatus]
MFLATFTFHPKMVIGYLITQLVILIFSSLQFALCIVSIFLPDSVGRFMIEHMFQMSFLANQLNRLDKEAEQEVVILLCFFFACLMFATFLWEVFLLRVSFQCYNYLLDVRDAREGVNRLPPLRLERNAERGVFLVGLEHKFDERDPLYLCCCEQIKIK